MPKKLNITNAGALDKAFEKLEQYKSSIDDNREFRYTDFFNLYYPRLQALRKSMSKKDIFFLLKKEGIGFGTLMGFYCAWLAYEKRLRKLGVKLPSSNIEQGALKVNSQDLDQRQASNINEIKEEYVQNSEGNTKGKKRCNRRSFNIPNPGDSNEKAVFDGVEVNIFKIPEPQKV